MITHLGILACGIAIGAALSLLYWTTRRPKLVLVQTIKRTPYGVKFTREKK